jgi:hypothetical protein
VTTWQGVGGCLPLCAVSARGHGCGRRLGSPIEEGQESEKRGNWNTEDTEEAVTMSFGMNIHFAAGTRVKVSVPMEVPEWSSWEDDRGRVSTPVKKRLQGAFFKGDRKVNAEVLYISQEGERDHLRRQGRVKIRARDATGTAVVFVAEAKSLVRSR